MKPSRFYQNCTQAIGSLGEIILFLMGFFLGKEMFITALIFLAVKIVHKLTVSEFMYKRSIAVIKEGIKDEN